jgi:hypothetical protein
MDETQENRTPQSQRGTVENKQHQKHKWSI